MQASHNAVGTPVPDACPSTTKQGMPTVVVEEAKMGAPEPTGIMEVGVPERTLESTEVAKANGLGQAPEPAGIPEVTGESFGASLEPLS
ncbi:hypothetical protein Nepgr_020558 [Nepenthes gracilis]|uniref:Uncharacterized protein n=1 Tax=Nepenthes gracilis TaxID=150966 RepID=A0AAD3XV62_NEPGR|nr:hypothetical protein Nepgr_020558 [Nepenthes gracilis]